MLCAIICFTPIISFDLGVTDTPAVFLLLGWLGISIGMHAIPSAQDVAIVSATVRASGRGSLYRVAKAFELLVRLANGLHVVWFDLIYAIGVAWLAPGLISLFVIR